MTQLSKCYTTITTTYYIKDGIEQYFGTFMVIHAILFIVGREMVVSNGVVNLFRYTLPFIEIV